MRRIEKNLRYVLMFCVFIPSRRVCHDVVSTQPVFSRPQGDVKYNVPCLHVDFPIILYSD